MKNLLLLLLLTSNSACVLAQTRTYDGSLVMTVAGTGVAGQLDGLGRSALLNKPHGLAQSNSEVVYFADRGNHQIRAFNINTQEIKTLAGSGQAGFADGNGKSAQFSQPIAVVASKSGVLFVADRDNHRVRKIDLTGQVTTLAGSGVAGFLDGQYNEAKFNQPYGVALDAREENLLVADYLNHSIRSINLITGVVATLAGNGIAGKTDAVGREASFNQPYNIKHDGHGNYYIPDQLNHSIRILKSSGEVVTLAGNGKAGYADGAGLQAQFNNPTGLAISQAGEVYVADRNNHRIRKISIDGVVTTLAGTGAEGDKDGTLAEAEFKRPIDLILEPTVENKLIISEENGHRLRLVK